MLKKIQFPHLPIAQKKLDRIHLFATIAIVGLLAFSIASAYWSLLPPRKDLYNELWGPAYLLVHHQSPYDTASLNAELRAAWFPMAIGLFFPIGWLSESAALYTWFCFGLFQIGAIVLLAQQSYKPAYLTLFTAIFAFAFPSTIYHLLLGQISLTATLATVLALIFLKKEKHWASAFFLAVGLIKPHLLTVTMLGLSLWYLRRGGVRSVILFWARVMLWVLVLCLPLFIAYPNWIPDAVESMRTNTHWSFPTLLNLLSMTLGLWGKIIWAVLFVATLSLGVYLWNKLEPVRATYCSLGLALLITPYMGSWDFVVLLPLLVFTFAKSNWKQRIFILLSYGLAWYGMALVQAMPNSHNRFFWWVPVWFLGTLLPIILAKRQQPE